MSAQQLITEHIDLWTSAIKAKNTQGRGSSKKRELYGIKKLRELILELAVRGKLVPQDPSDEPASVLLKRIAVQYEQRVKNTKIKAHKLLPEFTDEENLCEFPGSWVSARLGKVSENLDRLRKPISKGDRTEGDYPYYGASGVVDYVAEYIFNEPLVLIGEDGAKWGCGDYTAFLVDGKYWVNNHVHAIRPSRSIILDQFLVYQLAQQDLQKYITGITVPKLNQARLSSIVLLIPSLAEQHRIVAKVDELMALCDQLEQQTESSLDAHNLLVDTLLSTLTDARDAKELSDNWARLADHFDTLITTDYAVEQLKQTILQLAVMGKLVPQDPNDEPASELLERIAAEKNRLLEQKKLKTKANPIISHEDQWLSVPSSWKHLRLGNLAKFIDYRGKTPTKLSQGVRLITAKNVRFGYISLEPEEFISEEEYVSWMTRGFPKLEDLLFTPEAPLGNVAIIDIKERFALAQRAICFQLHESKCAGFLRIIIMSKPFQEQLSLNATGMTATGIKASKLKEIVIPVPPLKEQHRIVAKVDELMTLCDQLKAQLNHAQTTQLHLSDAVVENALTK